MYDVLTTSEHESMRVCESDLPWYLRDGGGRHEVFVGQGAGRFSHTTP